MAKKPKKPKKHTPLHIYDETYQTNYYVSYGVPENEFRLAMDRIKGFRPENELYAGRTYWWKDQSVVWLWTRTRDVTTLAHECFHAVEYTLLPKGLRLSDESSEAFAYQLSMLMRRILKGAKK